MGRYVTPAGVEIEMSDESAAQIGFAPVKPKGETKSASRKQADKPDDKK